MTSPPFATAAPVQSLAEHERSEVVAHGGWARSAQASRGSQPLAIDHAGRAPGIQALPVGEG
jgi:hypothetical protein